MGKIMVCSLCGGEVIWIGPLVNLTDTKCQSCGEINCQVVEDASYDGDATTDAEETAYHTRHDDEDNPATGEPDSVAQRSSRCYGVVTHQQLEILNLVSKLPRKYIEIRRVELIRDYAHVLQARQAWEAFLAMIGGAEFDSLSEKGRACLRSFSGRRDYRAFCQRWQNS